MKKLIVVLFVLAGSFSYSQNNPALQSMVDAEKAFIKMAKERNRRDAFLFYLSDDAVTSGPNGPRKGLAHIQSRPAGKEWLFWEVGYSDIAASGDFGYNSGPWEYRNSRNDEKPVAYGEFNSVWKKINGSWKNVLDVGIDHAAPQEKITWSTSANTLKTSFQNSDAHSEILKMENDFLNSLSADRHNAYLAHLSGEARIMYPDYMPFLTDESKEKFLNELPTPKNIRVLDGDAASSGDLGYVYGVAEVAVAQKGKTEIKKATYVRIWKKEGRTWKIVLDVLSF